MLLINVARFDPIKGHATMFEALRLAHKDGSKAMLACVGRDTDCPLFAKLALDCGVGAWVAGLGQKANVAEEYTMVDAFLFGSTAENSPLVVPEALAAGLPVISTDVGDVREVAGRHGIIVPVGDARAMADAILRVEREPWIRQEAKIGGPIQVQTLYSPDAFVSAWSDMLALEAPRLGTFALLRRPIEFASAKLREAWPPLRVWAMAIVAWIISGAITFGLVPLIPDWPALALIKSNVVWIGLVFHFFAIFGLLGHSYHVLVGAAVDKGIEIAKACGGAPPSKT